MEHAFKFAVKWGYLKENPMTEGRIELPRGYSKRLSTAPQLTPGEFLRLLPLPRLRLRGKVAVALAGWLGPRGEEIFGLKWQDLDLETGEVNFVQGIYAGRITNLKTEASHENLPMPEDVWALLRQWRSVTDYNRPDDWVFASPRKKGALPITHNNFMKNDIRPIALAAGLPAISWYSFRHSLNAWAKDTRMTAEDRKTLLRQKSTKVNEGYGKIAIETKRHIQQQVLSYVEQHGRNPLTQLNPAPQLGAEGRKNEAVKMVVQLPKRQSKSTREQEAMELERERNKPSPYFRTRSRNA
jgi:integrase